MKQQSSFLKTVHSFAQKNFSRNIFRTTRSAFAGALFVFFFGCAAHHEQYERPESEAQKQATLANTYYNEGNFPLAIKHWRASAFQGGVESQALLKSLITLEQKDLDPTRHIVTFRGLSFGSMEKLESYESIAAQWRQKTNLNKEEQFNLGTFLAFYEGHHKFPITPEIFALWLNSAKQGYDKAQFAVGYTYDVSDGVPANKAEAAKWYRLAAAQNHPWAQWMLDAMLAEGEIDTSPPATQNTQDSFQVSADADAEYRLGWQCYQAKDQQGALVHYCKAALAGHPEAQYNLALAYAYGKGVPKDEEKANYWFKQAAEKGVTGAKAKTSKTPAKTKKAKVEDTSHSGRPASPLDIQRWEREGNVPKLSQTARNKKESAPMRKLSLESLARLNWEPTNQERLQVYGTFASAGDYDSAQLTMQSFTAEAFSALDRDILSCANLLNGDGQWSDPDTARGLYNKIHAQNSTAVAISLCQQVAARPQAERTAILLLSIKLGLQSSENPLIALLLEYGDKPMAEDYLNCGSSRLNEGGRQWAQANGFNVGSGNGSHRSQWGSF